MFCFGHGTFVVDMFGGDVDSIPAAMQVIMQGGLQLALIALVVSHGFSFVRNFLMRGEIKEASISEVMFSPYKRIVVLHVFIILGGVALQSFGVTQVGLITLAIVKIVADLIAHKMEHKKANRSERSLEKFKSYCSILRRTRLQYCAYTYERVY